GDGRARQLLGGHVARAVLVGEEAQQRLLLQERELHEALAEAAAASLLVRERAVEGLEGDHPRLDEALAETARGGDAGSRRWARVGAHGTPSLAHEAGAPNTRCMGPGRWKCLLLSLAPATVGARGGRGRTGGLLAGGLVAAGALLGRGLVT